MLVFFYDQFDIGKLKDCKRLIAWEVLHYLINHIKTPILFSSLLLYYIF